MPDNPKPVEDLFTWWTVAKLAFATGLFTAVFNQGIAWLKETRQDHARKRHQGQQIALGLVGLLTAYAQECKARVDHNEHDADEGGIGYFCKMPDLPPYPVGDGWGALPADIAASLQDLRNEVAQATRHIEACSEVNGPPEGIDAATSRYVDVGHLALMISERLRKHYKFGAYQTATGYMFADELRRRYKENRRGRFGNMWNSRFVDKMRRALSRGRRRLMRALTEMTQGHRT